MIFFLGLHWGMHPATWRVCRLARALGIGPERVGEWERYIPTRPAYVRRVIGEEQARLGAT